MFWRISSDRKSENGWNIIVVRLYLLAGVPEKERVVNVVIHTISAAVTVSKLYLVPTAPYLLAFSVVQQTAESVSTPPRQHTTRRLFCSVQHFLRPTPLRRSLSSPAAMKHAGILTLLSLQPADVSSNISIHSLTHPYQLKYIVFYLNS